MYPEISVRRRRRRPSTTYIILAIILIIGLLVAVSQTIWVTLNLWEFGDLFVRPVYFSLIGGLILSFAAFFRFDFKHRNSLIFWFFKLISTVYRGGGYLRPRDIDFASYRLSPMKFLAWQLTKTLVGMVFFSNSLFGMSLIAAVSGVDLGFNNIPNIMTLPFTSITIRDVTPALTVISAAPALILIIPPFLSAIGVRLTLLVGITMLVKSVTRSTLEYLETGTVRLPIETIEAIIAIGTAWTGFNLFFSSYIDYNTKILIGGAIAVAALMLTFIYLDKTKPGFSYAYIIKIGAVVLVLLTIFAAATIQNSIADARKVEWLGPYVKQEITVNRYLADINDVRTVYYNFTGVHYRESVSENWSDVRAALDTVRLWDWDAAFTKLKPEIGLIPYVDFEDSDILRFNGRLYWSASMKPVLPQGIPPADIWYNEHLVYTHVPNGFLLLDASNGTIVDTSTFFKQRRIYYGEGGLLDQTWAAIILGKEKSDEVAGYRYNGRGGVVISPPVSWMFDVTFLLSYPDKDVRVLRYRDVYDRLSLLFPYFKYHWNGEYVDMFPVTDGENTYWLMPLIVEVPADNLPWSRGNEYVRFIGYALIDVYNGDVKLLIIGDDFMSKLIRETYSDIVLDEAPRWIINQTRFPEEVFQYQVEMFNIYHVDDPATFIQAREFYEIPEGVYTYYIIAQPPGFEKPEFLGILSLQLRGSPGRNLAGFIAVRNDYNVLGEKIFYKVPIESPIKLLGPSAAREALERYAEFRKLRTLLENPRIGETILYQVGGYLVYVIPVYTSPAGGVVTQLGTIATVGAEFTGKYFVGLGATPEESFRAFLKSLAGEAAVPVGVDLMNLTIKVVRELGLEPVFPESINAHVVFREGNLTYVTQSQFEEDVRGFLEEWALGRGMERALIWRTGNMINLGVIFSREGVVELHYITILGG